MHYSEVDDSILVDYVQIGKGAKVRRAIIDKGVCIPDGQTVGYDREADLARGYTVTETGLTVIAKVISFPDLSAP
jgi:glucose-1-phosphate adenylyltransferase